MSYDSSESSYNAALQKFGDILRRKRQGCRWTCYAMGEKIGVDETVISQLEIGVDTATELEREKICEFLGLDLDTFPRLLRNHNTLVQPKAPPPAPSSAGRNIVDFIGYREHGKRPLHIERIDNPGNDG